MRKRWGRSVKLLIPILMILLLLQTACSGELRLPAGTEVPETAEASEEETGLKVGEEELPEHLTWYYSNLSEEEQRVYLQMYVIFRDHMEYTPVDCTDSGELSRIMEYVLLDNPQFYYVDNLNLQYTLEGEEIVSMRIMAAENMTSEEQREADVRIKAFADNVLSGISEEMSDYEKALYLYDAIIDSVEYDLDAPYNQSLYSAALGKSVCKGYACAYQYLCNMLGLSCISLHGTLEGQEHAWNMILLDGQWCHVDCTSGEDLMDSLGVTDYAWFGATDAQIAATHVCGEPELLPEAEDLQNNFFYKMGRYFETADTKRLAELLERGEDFALQCGSDEVYHEMYDALLGNEDVQGVLGNLKRNVKYGRVDPTRTIYFFFL